MTFPFPTPDHETLTSEDLNKRYSEYLEAYTSYTKPRITSAIGIAEEPSTLLTIDDEPIGKLDDLPLWAQFYIKHLWKQLTEKDKSK